MVIFFSTQHQSNVRCDELKIKINLHNKLWFSLQLFFLCIELFFNYFTFIFISKTATFTMNGLNIGLLHFDKIKFKKKIYLHDQIDFHRVQQSKDVIRQHNKE